MDSKSTLDYITEEKELLKKGTALLISDQDKEFFSKKKKSLQTAEKMAKNDEQRELLLHDLVQTAHQLVFLLFRKQLLTDEVKDLFIDSMTIESANQRYAGYDDIRKEREDAINGQIKILREETDKMDIFKGVLAGMSEEKAKEELAKYKESVAQTMGR